MAACEDTQLSLDVKASAVRYPSGSPPQFTLTITNKGPAPCTRDVGPAQRGFVITTGGVRAWASTDCAAATPAPTTLEVNKPLLQVLPWNRHLSDQACTAATTAKLAANGTYLVTGVLGSLRKEGTPFSLAS